MKTVSSSLIHRILPPERPTASAHPALIMLHGRGADEEDLLGLAPMLDERLFIISARAPIPFSSGGGYTWYDVGDAGIPDAATFNPSYEKLLTFVHDAIRNYPVDGRRIFLFGFSMGTVMSYAVALSQPGLIRGVAANSGYIPERTVLELKWHELQNTAFFIIHGTDDQVIPVAFARRARELFANSNAACDYREYQMGHQISEESIAEVSGWIARQIDR